MQKAIKWTLITLLVLFVLLLARRTWASPEEILSGKVIVMEAMCETPKGEVHCFFFAETDELAKAKSPNDLSVLWVLMEDKNHAPSQILEIKKDADKPKVIWDKEWKAI